MKAVIRADPGLSIIIADLSVGPTAPKHYSLSQDVLFYNDHLVLPRGSHWVSRLLQEFHASPGGGHAGASCTYKRLSAKPYWAGMTRDVMKFVATCDVC